ncbi:hypothetical protein B7486_54925 [cyanobacterium TDX16]|nr:hypothetical protein B7486_54925 [cyanobacterium TDX16]
MAVATRFIAVRGRQQRLALPSSTTGNIPVVPVERFSISFEEDLAARVRSQATSEATSVSAWMAEACERRLRNDALRQVIAEWEHEHGEIDEDRIEAARRRLGIAPQLEDRS